MGNSRGSRSRLVADDTVWASEAEGEEAVLAEFADETALAQPGPRPVPTPERSERPFRGLRLFNPHTPMKEVVRIVLVGCLSAMALGASFAIGFGYVWSDLSVVPPPGETATPAAAANQAPSQLSVPGTASSGSAVTTSDPESTATPAELPPLAAEVRDSPIVPAAPSPNSPNRPGPATLTDLPGSDPGPAFGVQLQPAASNRAAGERSALPPSPSDEQTLLASQPMLSTDSAVIAAPVAPSSPVTPPAPIPVRATSIVESNVSTPRADLEAVNQAIARYQMAYSQKDVGAMALVWPSVDVAGVARAFENVDRQALTLTDCRVTTAGNIATAVCPGQVRYVGRVGARQLQERQGTWTIALERNGDVWQFTRLNVR